MLVFLINQALATLALIGAKLNSGSSTFSQIPIFTNLNYRAQCGFVFHFISHKHIIVPRSCTIFMQGIFQFITENTSAYCVPTSLKMLAPADIMTF